MPQKRAEKQGPDADGEGVGSLVEAAMVELHGRVVQIHAVHQLAVLLVVACGGQDLSPCCNQHKHQTPISGEHRYIVEALRVACQTHIRTFVM